MAQGWTQASRRRATATAAGFRQRYPLACLPAPPSIQAPTHHDEADVQEEAAHQAVGLEVAAVRRQARGCAHLVHAAVVQVQEHRVGHALVQAVHLEEGVLDLRGCGRGLLALAQHLRVGGPAVGPGMCSLRLVQAATLGQWVATTPPPCLLPHLWRPCPATTHLDGLDLTAAAPHVFVHLQPGMAKADGRAE